MDNPAEFAMCIAEESGLRYSVGKMCGVIIYGSTGNAVELDYFNGSNGHILFYYLSNYDESVIDFCDEYNLADPKSIDDIMGWISKLKA